MVMLLTRMHEIANREGFEIEVTTKSARTRRLLVRRNGVLGPYPFKRKLRDSKSVNDWKKERFEATYPGYTCKVLKGDGTVAAGQTNLRTVRRSYRSSSPQST
jgi:hypothetical protein